jgi:hypothetical protein
MASRAAERVLSRRREGALTSGVRLKPAAGGVRSVLWKLQIVRRFALGGWGPWRDPSQQWPKARCSGKHDESGAGVGEAAFFSDPALAFCCCFEVAFAVGCSLGVAGTLAAGLATVACGAASVEVSEAWSGAIAGEDCAASIGIDVALPISLDIVPAVSLLGSSAPEQAPRARAPMPTKSVIILFIVLSFSSNPSPGCLIPNFQKLMWFMPWTSAAPSQPCTRRRSVSAPRATTIPRL